MSLILDALRKADAERERGSVPGLRSQPVVPLSEAAAAARAPSRAGWLWAAVGLAVGIALIATWIVASRTAQPRVEAVPVAVPAAPFANRGADVVTPAATLPSTPPAGGQVAVAPTPVAEPAPWTRPGEPAADATAPRAAGTAAADAPVYPHDLLPSHVRSALPQLAISGSIYSPDPAGRSLIVNGRLVRERERLTPELALEEIRPKSAIFGFRGYRFEVLF